MFIQVALNLPVEELFTYRVTGRESHKPEVGKRAIVPFGPSNRLQTGIIVSVSTSPPEGNFEIKEVFDIPDPYPLFTETLFRLAEFVSRRYCSSLGEALFRFLPGAFIVEEKVRVSPLNPQKPLTPKEEELHTLISSFSSPVSVSFLRRKFGGSSLNAYLKRLVEKGAARLNTQLKPGGPPKEKWVRYLKEGKCGPKGRELLNLLKKHGELPLKHLTYFGFSRGVIENLRQKGLIQITEKESLLPPPPPSLSPRGATELTQEQKAVLENLFKYRGIHLLSGVTCSGKMEVYLHAARRAVDSGNSVLILVPELLLTPELQSRIESLFGTNYALYHGGLTPAQRASVWLKALKGEVPLIVGTRIAVALPMKNLGLIVLDEEQDPSYKEQQKPYYHARTVAVKRSELEKVPLLLVSATPSVESYYRAKRGEFLFHFLPSRVTRIPPPKVELVDLKKERKRVGIFSEKLLSALERAVNSGGQALLFINRRGYSHKIICPNCGYTLNCKKCGVPVTYHKEKKCFICHLCGTRYKLIFRCIKCGQRLEFTGYGTERVTQELKLLYPNWKIERFDLDTVKTYKDANRLIKLAVEGKIDVIVGTSIAVKGHNLPNLTFLGILIADQLTGPPDYMGAERAYQAIVQAIGRVGRFKPGYAVVQAFNPDFYPIKYAVTGQFHTFYEEELSYRKLFNYPPYTLGAVIEVEVPKTQKSKLKELYAAMKKLPSQEVSKPLPLPNGKTYSIFIKLKSDTLLPKIKQLLSRFKVTYKIDVEPIKIP